MSIRKLENGSGVGFSVMIDGNVVNFKLAIFARRWFRDTEEMEYGFISDDQSKYFKGTYSGGNTGMGVDGSALRTKSSIPEGYRLVTIDLNEITKLAEEFEEAARLQKEEHENEMRAKVEEINRLPEAFEVGIPVLEPIIWFKRSEAYYNPRQSSRIQGGGFDIEFKDGKKRFNFSLSNYKTETGRLRTKNFASDMRHLFSDVAFQLDAKETLQGLIDRQNELTNMVRKI